MKSFKLILSILIAFMVMTSVDCIKKPKSEHSNREKREKKSKKKSKKKTRKVKSTELSLNDVVINLSKKSYCSKKLKEFKNEARKLDSKKRQKLLSFLKEECSILESLEVNILNLPYEVLLHIFEYCVALPTDFGDIDSINSIKERCLKKVHILLVCKNFQNYEQDLNNFIGVDFDKALMVPDLESANKKVNTKSIHEISINNDQVLILFKIEIRRKEMLSIMINMASKCPWLREIEKYDEKLLKNLIFVDIVFNKAVIEAYASRMTELDIKDINEQDLDGNTLLMRIMLKKFSKNHLARFNVPVRVFKNEKVQGKGVGQKIKPKVGAALDIPETIYPFLIKLMINNDANVNTINNNAETPLILLIKQLGKSRYFDECFYLLCSKEMAVNIQDKNGNSALMLLVGIENCTDYMRYFNVFAEYGADFSLTNNEGKTLIEMARPHRRVPLEHAIDEVERRRAKNLKHK